MAQAEDPDATAVFAAVGRRPSLPLPPLPPRPAGRPATASTQTFTRPPEFARPPVPPRPPAPRAPGLPRPGTAAHAPAVPQPAPAPHLCRCGAEPIATCEECSRPVCAEHSTLWRGWRICDQDLAAGQERSRRAAEEDERRLKAAAEAAKAEREWRRNTLLDLSPEQALCLLYVEDPRTEQDVRSAVHVLRRLSAARFTQLCLAVLPRITHRTKSRGLFRRSGWAFAGEHFHDRSWFLTRGGTWFRSGSYGESGAEQGYSGRRIRLDDTEKRAVIYDMAWQQERNGFLP